MKTAPFLTSKPHASNGLSSVQHAFHSSPSLHNRSDRLGHSESDSQEEYKCGDPENVPLKPLTVIIPP